MQMADTDGANKYRVIFKDGTTLDLWANGVMEEGGGLMVFRGKPGLIRAFSTSAIQEIILLRPDVPTPPSVRLNPDGTIGEMPQCLEAEVDRLQMVVAAGDSLAETQVQKLKDYFRPEVERLEASNKRLTKALEKHHLFFDDSCSICEEVLKGEEMPHYTNRGIHQFDGKGGCSCGYKSGG